ncbi:MAG: M36 family metallopeptidase, partial [Bacteroidota bacterium]
SPISQFGPKKFPSITGNLVMMNDSLGCAAATNASAIAGKIAIIYRGTCGFTQKVKNAQNAGAIAAVVINNSANTPTSMTGFDNTITIPSYIIAQTIGRQIADTLRKGDSVNVTLQGTPDVKTYDSDFDNGVIAHEFGHGISIRLTGGPANSSCLNNQEQAGEGWSDFFALALTAKSTDKAEDGRGIGTYVANQATNGLGIRTFRYSRSLTVSDNTSYNDVKTLSVPHGVGSVWCVMLWDIFWDMVDKYGFNEDLYAGNGGNNKTIQLVIDGLKLQPCNPGFVDSRNAILKADSINNGGANYELLWRAFARRGLGYSASQGLTSSRTDGTESFDLPPNIVNTGVQKLNAISGIKMAPNPSEGWINILFPEAIQSAKLQVYDISGKCVFTQDIFNTDNQRVSLQNMENGIYFVEIKDNKGNVFQQKL